MTFAELLKDLMKENNVTQTQLSSSTGIPLTTINGWVNAGRLPDYNSLRILSVYFQISADELLLLNSSSADDVFVSTDNRRKKRRN